MNTKIRSLVATAVTSTFLLGFGTAAMADSTFDLVDALIKKGVLTEEEGLSLMKGKETEDREKKKAGVSTKFKDGLTFESGDGENKFSINGRIQLDYRDFDTSEDTTSAQANNADTFDIRRAYLGAKGTFLKYYDFEVTADFASQSGANSTSAVCTNAACTSTANAVTSVNTSHLDVAYMNVKWWQEAQFQFGQFKMPFSLEERTSSRFLDFQERSFVNNGSLVPGKERGFMVHGTPFTGVNYALAFSNGQGKNTNETDNREDGKDVIVHADTNIAEIIGNKDMVIHLGASYTQGDLPVAAVSSQRTEGRGAQFFSTAAFTGAEMERTRKGLEGAFAYGPVKVQAEWAQTNFEGTSAGNVSFDRELDAYYAEALWLITGETYASAYKGGKFDRIKPTTNFDPQAKGMGAWEVGVRYSKFDASDFKTVANGNVAGTGVLATGATNEADAWTLGLKWIVNPNMRVMINYVDTDFDTPVTLGGKVEDGEKAITLRTQFDF